MSLHIGRKIFASKAAAERHIREMFWRYPPMGELTGEDLEFVLALIEMHPSRNLIHDCGIRSIHIQPVPFHEHDQRRFLVKRTDSSWHDFAWRNALSPRSPQKQLAAVLRHEIHPQTREFKQREFRGQCETCATPLALEDCVVDHAKPVTFERLMADWLQTLRLTPNDIDIVKCKGYEEWSHMEDPALTQSWIEYHEINARLRCVCRRCNQSTLRASPKKVA